MTQVLVLAGAKRCALKTCAKKKKMQALLLGLAKSIYYSRASLVGDFFLDSHDVNV